MRQRLLNDKYSMHYTIYTFFFFALSCLIVAEVYFIVGAFAVSECAQNFLQTYPAVSYLCVGLTYILKSIAVQKIERLAEAGNQQEKEKIMKNHKIRLVVLFCIFAVWVIVYAV